ECPPSPRPRPPTGEPHSWRRRHLGGLRPLRTRDEEELALLSYRAAGASDAQPVPPAESVAVAGDQVHHEGPVREDLLVHAVLIGEVEQQPAADSVDDPFSAERVCQLASNYWLFPPGVPRGGGRCRKRGGSGGRVVELERPGDLRFPRLPEGAAV